jgi:hypothetical protein
MTLSSFDYHQKPFAASIQQSAKDPFLRLLAIVLNKIGFPPGIKGSETPKITPRSKSAYAFFGFWW